MTLREELKQWKDIVEQGRLCTYIGQKIPSRVRVWDARLVFGRIVLSIGTSTKSEDFSVNSCKVRLGID